MKDNQYSIPVWCRKDCYFRDSKAESRPACLYPFKLQEKVVVVKVKNKKKCLYYRQKMIGQAMDSIAKKERGNYRLVYKKETKTIIAEPRTNNVSAENG